MEMQSKNTSSLEKSTLIKPYQFQNSEKYSLSLILEYSEEKMGVIFGKKLLAPEIDRNIAKNTEKHSRFETLEKKDHLKLNTKKWFVSSALSQKDLDTKRLSTSNLDTQSPPKTNKEKNALNKNKEENDSPLLKNKKTSISLKMSDIINKGNSNECVIHSDGKNQKNYILGVKSIKSP